MPEIYRSVGRLARKHPGKSIVVDLTSGTKAMTAGVGAAAFFLQQGAHPDLKVAYVDSDEYDPALRKPVPGTERLILLPNPHEVLGDLDEHIARELYGARKFGQAAQRFRELRGKTGQGGFGLYATLCEGYRQWYALEFGGARSNLRRLLDELRQDAWLRHDLATRRRALEVQREGLEAVCQLLHAGDLSRADGVVWLCATLLHLGRECEGAQPDGRPVLAALYYYRAVELLLQHRLAVHGYDADHAHLSDSLREGMRQNIARWLDTPADRVAVSCRLGLLEDMALLRALGDPVVQDMTDAEIRGYQGILQARNRSLLIHGLQLSQVREVERLGQLASRLLEKVREQAGLDPQVAPLFLP